MDDLDKETNNYIMRCKEWYGWHFPELAKIVQDNIAFCKTVQKIGEKHRIHLPVIMYTNRFQAIARMQPMLIYQISYLQR